MNCPFCKQQTSVEEFFLYPGNKSGVSKDNYYEKTAYFNCLNCSKNNIIVYYNDADFSVFINNYCFALDKNRQFICECIDNIWRDVDFEFNDLEDYSSIENIKTFVTDCLLFR